MCDVTDSYMTPYKFQKYASKGLNFRDIGSKDIIAR